MVSNSKPSADVDYFTNSDDAGNTIIPVAALLAGGVAEVLFGIAGCYLAIASLVYNYNNVKTTIGFLIMQSILGWFVFITYVVADPILAAINTEANDLLSLSERRSLIILGNMLGSITFCWALQGGQFVMGLRLLAAQKGQEVSAARNALRAKVWSGNVLAAAFSTLFVGIMLAAKDFTSDTAPIGLPPHVIWYPSISIVTGLVMFAYGVLGVMASNNSVINNKYMPAMWMLTTTMMMVNFSWTFGIVPGLAPPIPGAAQHIGLIFSVTILPMFHAHRAHNSIESDDLPKSAESSSDFDEEKQVTDSSNSNAGKMKEPSSTLYA